MVWVIEGAGWLAVKGRPFQLWDSRRRPQNSNRLLSASSRFPSNSLRKFVQDALDIAGDLLVLLRCGAVDDGRLGLHVEGERCSVRDAHEHELMDIGFAAGLATERAEVMRKPDVKFIAGHGVLQIKSPLSLPR
nr:MAG TPA: hypothetical protein [Caudoviricetes sp.]